jgi:hypothetical protein
MQSFILPHTKRVASAMSASSTVITSSTKSRTTGHVLEPSSVFNPSASVSLGALFHRVPTRGLSNHGAMVYARHLVRRPKV